MILTGSIDNCKKKTKLKIQIGSVVLFMLVIQYCQVLSEINLMILFNLIISVFVLSANRLYTNNIKDA